MPPFPRVARFIGGCADVLGPTSLPVPGKICAEGARIADAVSAVAGGEARGGGGAAIGGIVREPDVRLWAQAARTKKIPVLPNKHPIDRIRLPRSSAISGIFPHRAVLGSPGTPGGKAGLDGCDGVAGREAAGMGAGRGSVTLKVSSP